MSKGRSRLVVVLVALVALLAAAVGSTTPAQAVDTGKVRGQIVQSGGGIPKVNLSWFASDWTFLGKRKVSGGVYSISLRPGTYYLQFTDLRPSYDVTKSAPATVKVTVRAATTVGRTVRMRRGASIGGTVKAGGKVAAGARIVAANTDEQSFESTANKQGQFALGGLPPGNYSVFTYDKRAAWVGRSTYLRGLKGPTYKNVDISLPKRAGTLLVDLYAGSSVYPGAAFVTAVSRATGQFWTAKASRGSVTFRGLYPGSYNLQVPGVGNYLGATVHVPAKVAPAKVKFGSARLTRRGGWITGRITDQSNGQPLEGAPVRLFAQDGTELDRTSSSSSGAFTLDGQLTTQSGLTVVAGPGPKTYLHNCLYKLTRVTGQSLTTGQQTALGDVVLVPTDDTPAQCRMPVPVRTSVRAS